MTEKQRLKFYALWSIEIPTPILSLFMSEFLKTAFGGIYSLSSQGGMNVTDVDALQGNLPQETHFFRESDLDLQGLYADHDGGLFNLMEALLFQTSTSVFGASTCYHFTVSECPNNPAQIALFVDRDSNGGRGNQDVNSQSGERSQEEPLFWHLTPEKQAEYKKRLHPLFFNPPHYSQNELTHLKAKMGEEAIYRAMEKEDSFEWSKGFKWSEVLEKNAETLFGVPLRDLREAKTTSAKSDSNDLTLNTQLIGNAWQKNADAALIPFASLGLLAPVWLLSRVTPAAFEEAIALSLIWHHEAAALHMLHHWKERFLKTMKEDDAILPDSQEELLRSSNKEKEEELNQSISEIIKKWIWDKDTLSSFKEHDMRYAETSETLALILWDKVAIAAHLNGAAAMDAVGQNSKIDSVEEKRAPLARKSKSL